VTCLSINCWGQKRFELAFDHCIRGIGTLVLMVMVAVATGFSLGHLYFSGKVSSLSSEFVSMKTSIFTH
jgi:hypothetical protein